jgi:protein gp37
MGDVTRIGWTDHSFNGWWGCAHISPGCANCYAHAWALRWGHDVFHLRGARRMLSDRNWDRPRAWNRAAEMAGVPTRAFAFSMGDVFEDHPALPGPRARFFRLVEETPWVTWQILTKRIVHVAGMVPWAAGDWPPNVHLGTSAENQELAEERIPVLAALDGPAVLFVSAEPLLSPVDLGRWLPGSAGSSRAENPGLTAGRWIRRGWSPSSASASRRESRCS